MKKIEFRNVSGYKVDSDITYLLCSDCKVAVHQHDWNNPENTKSCTGQEFHTTDLNCPEFDYCLLCSTCISESKWRHAIICEEYYREHRTKKDKRHSVLNCDFRHIKHSKPRQDK